VRMSDSRLPKQIFYGELSSGKRSAGGQKKRYKDSLKVSVKDFGIRDNTWETLAKNRSAWRAGITSGAHSAEARRLDEAEKKRAARKARAGSTSALGSEHVSDLRERLSCSDRTPQPPPHSSPTQHFQLTKSRGHLRLRRTNIIMPHRYGKLTCPMGSYSVT